MNTSTHSPLENDLSGGGGVPRSHSNTVREDSPPPPYTPDPEAVDQSDVADDEILPDFDDDEPPPEYTFQVHSLDNIDENAGTARLNGFQVVSMKTDPLELGENDAEGLSRKYYLIVPGFPDRLVVLKIVDLLKAEKLGKHLPRLLRREGQYWYKVCLFWH